MEPCCGLKEILNNKYLKQLGKLDWMFDLKRKYITHFENNFENLNMVKTLSSGHLLRFDKAIAFM